MATTVLLHHPQIRKEIRRGPRLAALLKKQSGWREGPLPEPESVKPVTSPSGEGDVDTSDAEAKPPAKKTAAPKAVTSGEGK